MLNDRVRPALKQYKRYFPGNAPKGALEAMLDMTKATAHIAACAQSYATGGDIISAMQEGTRHFGEFVKDCLRARAGRIYYKYVNTVTSDGDEDGSKNGTARANPPPPPPRRGRRKGTKKGGEWVGQGARWKPYNVDFDKRPFGFRAELDITENFVKVTQFKRKARSVLSQVEEYGVVQVGDRLAAIGDWTCTGRRIEAVLLKLARVPRPCRLRFETLSGANRKDDCVRQVRLEVERATGLTLTVGRRYFIKWEFGRYVRQCQHKNVSHYLYRYL